MEEGTKHIQFHGIELGDYVDSGGEVIKMSDGINLSIKNKTIYQAHNDLKDTVKNALGWRFGVFTDRADRYNLISSMASVREALNEQVSEQVSSSTAKEGSSMQKDLFIAISYYKNKFFEVDINNDKSFNDFVDYLKKDGWRHKGLFQGQDHSVVKDVLKRLLSDNNLVQKVEHIVSSSTSTMRLGRLFGDDFANAKNAFDSMESVERTIKPLCTNEDNNNPLKSLQKSYDTLNTLNAFAKTIHSAIWQSAEWSSVFSPYSITHRDIKVEPSYDGDQLFYSIKYNNDTIIRVNASTMGTDDADNNQSPKYTYLRKFIQGQWKDSIASKFCVYDDQTKRLTPVKLFTEAGRMNSSLVSTKVHHWVEKVSDREEGGWNTHAVNDVQQPEKKNSLIDEGRQSLMPQTRKEYTLRKPWTPRTILQEGEKRVTEFDVQKTRDGQPLCQTSNNGTRVTGTVEVDINGKLRGTENFVWYKPWTAVTCLLNLTKRNKTHAVLNAARMAVVGIAIDSAMNHTNGATTGTEHNNNTGHDHTNTGANPDSHTNIDHGSNHTTSMDDKAIQDYNKQLKDITIKYQQELEKLQNHNIGLQNNNTTLNQLYNQDHDQLNYIHQYYDGKMLNLKDINEKLQNNLNILNQKFDDTVYKETAATLSALAFISGGVLGASENQRQNNAGRGRNT